MVAIGNFDGVHRGHQAVLTAAAERARARALVPLVLTFDPHPLEVLAGMHLDRLTDEERKAQLMARVSPELALVVEPFTRELAANTPEQFARDFLRDKLRAAHVIVGANFRFGQGRAGDLGTLQQLGERYGFDAQAEPLLADAERPISSSRIRELLRSGEVIEAARLLGRPHSVSGVVVQGDQRGRTIGFPTANISGAVEMLPPFGVYACLVDDISDGGAGRALGTAVTNLGVRPTVKEQGALSVEAHLLDHAPGSSQQGAFSGDLYGRRLRVHFVARLREERKFEGLPSLVAQIKADAEQAREALKKREPASVAWV
ncbi:MAG: bifunctional riboflavin kinase/FAD synthetase [Polyangiaceae bacterium]|nr:bifunctional riboflavin kinase/FAD synthetase [Polyangiaceae bacterium]MCB9607607.1 bifunctional riboflavin kinase/FAD synthetase [Polyangiaceae bacterium]